MKKSIAPLATPLLITPQPHQPNLSTGQKLFNTLVKDVEKSRATLAEWQAFVLAHDQKLASDYMPALDALRARQAEMVRVLDAALGRKGLTKSEQRVVQKIICNVAEQLIVDTDDEAIKEIYNRYSDTDFDAEEAAAVKSMKEAVKAMFNVDLGDADDLNSPEDIIEQLHARMEKEHRQRLNEQEQRAAKRKATKQTARQRAKEEKLKAEADQTRLSLREVYKKLVSALHPDREPDARERSRKTDLMQRVNQAYEKKDLLKLLELQLAIEQIDAHSIANLSAERLKHFNKILREQLSELAQEILAVQMPLREQLGIPPHQPIAIKTITPRLMRDIAEIKNQIQRIRNEILIVDNPVAFKRWIKAYRQGLKEREMFVWP